MTSKQRYSANVSQQKAAAKADKKLAREILEGQRRAADFKQNWQSVDLNEVVEKFAPGSVPHVSPKNGNKVYYQAPGSPIRITADLGGGYCRIEDTSAGTSKGLHLNLDGTNGHNYKDEQGKTHGRSRADYNQATHYRIKKPGE